MGRARVGTRHGWIVGVAVACILLSPVVLVVSLANSDWWWHGAEVDVPRDGRAHQVTVGQPGAAYAVWSDQSLIDPECVLRDDEGAEVPLRFTPRDKRAVVEAMYVAKPEASFLFTAPDDGVLNVRCRDVESRPVAVIGLDPAPNVWAFRAMNWLTVLPGPAMFLAGVILVIVAVVRRTRQPR